MSTATKATRKRNVYLVSTPTGMRLIRAFTPTGAIKFSARTHHAAIATQDELISNIAAGVKVEDANDAPGDQEELPIGDGSAGQQQQQVAAQSQQGTALLGGGA